MVCFACLYALYVSTRGVKSACSFISRWNRFGSSVTPGLANSCINSSKWIKISSNRSNMRILLSFPICSQNQVQGRFREYIPRQCALHQAYAFSSLVLPYRNYRNSPLFPQGSTSSIIYRCHYPIKPCPVPEHPQSLKAMAFKERAYLLRLITANF